MTENLVSALAAFQAELPKVAKGNTANTGTYSYSYADLADVSAAILPALANHGLTFSCRPTLDDQGRFVLSYVLAHVSGEGMSGCYPLPTGTPQVVGSAITYARRYVLLAITGVAPDGDDDDGRAAKETVVSSRPQRHWDPIEQDTLRAGWEAEIADAKDDEEIKAIGKRLLAAKRSGEISPATYDALAVLGGQRKGELNHADRQRDAVS